MDLSNLTVEEFIELKKKMDEAENDDTPYAVVADDQIQVVGDPALTEVKKHEYDVQFGYPNTAEWKERLAKNGEEIITETPNYIRVDRHYEDVWVSPRMHTAVQTSVVELYRFFVAVDENGELRDLTPDEMVQVLRTLDEPMIESMCHVVASLLGIPQSEEEYILVPSAAENVMQIAENFPEIFNGADFFTDKSSETK